MTHSKRRKSGRIATFVLLKVIGFFLPLRVREEDERVGPDLSLHGEALQ